MADRFRATSPIDELEFRNATIFALSAAVLSFFGLIHAASVGFNVSPDIEVGYVLMAAITGYLAVRKPAEETQSVSIPAVAEVATP